MNKLKLLVLSLLSLIFVNSCGALAIATLAGVGICGENRCVSYGADKKSDAAGLYIIKDKDFLKAKEYVKSLMLRPKEKLEIEEGIFVNVPKGLILKNEGTEKYFYDKLSNTGLPIRYGYNNRPVVIDTELISSKNGFNIYKVTKGISNNLNLFFEKNLINNKKIYIYIFKDRDENVPEFMEFYKDFMENL